MRLAARIAAPAAAALAALAALASVAAAEGALGVSLGRSMDERDAADDMNRTFGVWGRMRVRGRFTGQLELQRIESPVAGSRVRSVTALIAIDLLEGGRVMPVLLAGAGLDRAYYLGGNVGMRSHHFEGGLGIEYRGYERWVIGADLRLGGRSIENGAIMLTGADGPPPIGASPSSLNGIPEGAYLALRLSAGVRF